MPRYTVLGPVNQGTLLEDGKTSVERHFKIGAVIELTEDQAAELIACGAIDGTALLDEAQLADKKAVK